MSTEIIIRAKDVQLGDVILACRINRARDNWITDWSPWYGILVSEQSGLGNFERLRRMFATNEHEFKVVRPLPEGEGYMYYVKGQGWVYV